MIYTIYQLNGEAIYKLALNLAHLLKSNNETLTRRGKVNMESDQWAC